MSAVSKKADNSRSRSLAEIHPKLNFILGLVLFLILLAVVAFIVYHLIQYIGSSIRTVANGLASLASKMDAVVIVAMITSCVSIIGVVISSIIGKLVEFKKAGRSILLKNVKSLTVNLLT